MRTAVYPGSFDPVTSGHIDIITRASKVYDKIIVVVSKNSSKKPLFTVEERIDFIRRSTAHLPNVEIDSSDGLLVDYVKKTGSNVIIKGLRAVSDFEYEFQMALANKKIEPKIETLFMMTDARYSYLSSSIVKEMASLGADFTDLVPGVIINDIKNKFRNNGE